MIKKIQLFYAHISGLPKKKRILFYVGVFFVLLAVLDRLIITPIFLKIKILDEEIQKKEMDIRNDLLIVNHKDKMLSEKIEYGDFLVAAKSDEEERTSFLKEIESLAKENAVYLVDMKPAGIENMDISQKYFVNLNCEADMESIVKFMYAIANSKTLLFIEKCQISPKSKQSSEARCSMSISKISLKEI